MNNSCAYTVKKEVRIMSRPVPLMFVSGPPVYTRVQFEDEESTSIFVTMDESPELVEAPITMDESPELVEAPIEIKEVDPSILAKVERLQSSMGQRIYQGLTFILGDEEIRGNVGKLDGNTIIIEVNGDKDEIIAVELSEVQDIIWRGKTLPEN